MIQIDPRNFNQKYEIIDLSQPIYQGMPLFPMHQKTFIMKNMTHEENQAMTGSPTLGFSARNLLISEHAGTHVDAVWEFLPSGPTIEQMGFEFFIGDAICVDLRHVQYPKYIEPEDLKEAVEKAGLEIRKGDIFLMWTGHYDRYYPGQRYAEGPYTGVSEAAAVWLAEQGVVNIGIDAPAIDLTPDDLKFSGHWVCGRYGITDSEHYANLGKVAGKRFIYIGLPLKIKEGSGSPIRAIALLEKENK
ncbi:cyclase family protein [Neomoorella mulderi]|uniref:Kynurenine formamidase n=1 Tax=Moorella mulderi DSM 14980 TaxID=1122241 RepID=A0A151B287_9FIRM|nr:cyclase family protein [Moorella mulderi]KYH33903.1 kynurenine formamidase [Moorella mulderi DSM 14980]